MTCKDIAQNRDELITAITVSIYNTLNELGLSQSEASQVIENTINSTWRGAVYTGINDYMRKLELTGGRR